MDFTSATDAADASRLFVPKLVAKSAAITFVGRIVIGQISTFLDGADGWSLLPVILFSVISGLLVGLAVGVRAIKDGAPRLAARWSGITGASLVTVAGIGITAGVVAYLGAGDVLTDLLPTVMLEFGATLLSIAAITSPAGFDAIATRR